jgi:predicted enzyme related to lactoylglutathione lyase
VTITNALAGVAVDDLEAGVRWYSRVIDRQPDTRPMPEVAEWLLPRGGCLQIYADRERAGSSSVTLVVADLDEDLARLADEGIDTTRATETDIVRTSVATDPAGNQVVLAQPLSAAVAS